MIRLHEQHAQHAPLPGVSQVDGVAVDPGLHAAQHTELRRQLSSACPDQGIQEIHKAR
jgi:hypothetical protein